jgi:hypothetical protein
MAKIMTSTYQDISELRSDIKTLIESFYKDMGRTYYYDTDADDKPHTWQIEPDFTKNKFELEQYISNILSVVEDDLSNDI